MSNEDSWDVCEQIAHKLGHNTYWNETPMGTTLFIADSVKPWRGRSCGYYVANMHFAGSAVEIMDALFANRYTVEFSFKGADESLQCICRIVNTEGMCRAKEIALVKGLSDNSETLQARSLCRTFLCETIILFVKPGRTMSYEERKAV